MTVLPPPPSVCSWGHEGAGVVEAVGEGVTRVKPGDHIVCSFIPACGKCRFCARGKSNPCDYGALLMVGCLPDETFRFHTGSEDVAMSLGATHAAANADEAQHIITELTEGVGADKAILTAGLLTEETVSAAYSAMPGA